MKPVLLWADLLFFIFIGAMLVWLISAGRYEHWRQAWRYLASKPVAMAPLVLISAYLSVAFLDSVHFENRASGDNISGKQVKSVLDVLISPVGNRDERSYSEPLAVQSYQPVYRQQHGQTLQVYPHLQQAATHLAQPDKQHSLDLLKRTLYAILIAFVICAGLCTLLVAWLKTRYHTSWLAMNKKLWAGQTQAAWRTVIFTVSAIVLFICWAKVLSQHYYLFGTDQVGQSVFYQTISSIRTGLLIGTLTTLVMLPLAILFGVAAGFFGGRVDDIIQFVYITLSSIPAVLLIVASVLAFQVVLAKHPEWVPTSIERADLRLIGLCSILGITSWSSLCRLLRGETLKVREFEYLQASRALGASSWHMMRQHILPNIMHIVLITVVLDFSMLVLAEVVLSYIGVGVAPTMMSWGQMINKARLELAREPVVWWPLLSAFSFMFVFVLSINLFADALRDALDPRSREN